MLAGYRAETHVRSTGRERKRPARARNLLASCVSGPTHGCCFPTQMHASVKAWGSPRETHDAHGRRGRGKRPLPLPPVRRAGGAAPELVGQHGARGGGGQAPKHPLEHREGPLVARAGRIHARRLQGDRGTLGRGFYLLSHCARLLKASAKRAGRRSRRSIDGGARQRHCAFLQSLPPAVPSVQGSGPRRRLPPALAAWRRWTLGAPQWRAAHPAKSTGHIGRRCPSSLLVIPISPAGSV